MSTKQMKTLTVGNTTYVLGAGGIPGSVKEALLDCFEHVAWTDEHGQDYVDALEAALYDTPVSIIAAYNPTRTVYESQSLDVLKPDLVVTAYYDDGTSNAVTDYTLSGSLRWPSSIITATYMGLTAAFSVPVSNDHDLDYITAVYTQSGTVYTTDSLDSLKDDLVVTAVYVDSSIGTVPSASYTLSGTLSVGTSTITVNYEGKTTTFSVTVTAAPATLSSITAVYTQSGTVYDTDSLDSLKTDLVVTAVYSDSSTATVASTDYTLSGTLTEGTSTITVSYGGKTDTFTVTVSAPSLNYTYNWDFTQSLTDSVQGATLEPSGATRDSSGLHFTAISQYVLLAGLGVTGNCFELDIASVDRKGTQHGRVFTMHQSGVANSGLIYRSTGKWALYSYNESSWHDTELTSPTALDGKTITIKLLQNPDASYNNKLWMYVYVDGELLVDGSMGGSTNTNLFLGSDNGQVFYDMTITGLRVYQEA